jgi:hypothetical protein
VAPIAHALDMSNSKLPDDDYQKLKAFLGYFSDRFMNASVVPLAQRPVAVLDKMEIKSMSSARKGLAMAINDCISMSDGWSAKKVFEIDADLRSLGLVTISELRLGFSKKIQGILLRDKIKSEVEFYLVKDVVDGCSGRLATPEIAKLEGLLAGYASAQALRGGSPGS